MSVKVALKDLETLAHASTDIDNLSGLEVQLANVGEKFRKTLPKSAEGIVLLGGTLNHSSAVRQKLQAKRPAIVVDSDEIPTTNPNGRKRAHGVFKRVGRAAEREQQQRKADQLAGLL